MGVTIHFQGQLSSPGNYDQVIRAVQRFTEHHQLDYFLFQEEHKTLERVKNQAEWRYEGPTRGILVVPGDYCDPLILEFDGDDYVQEFCKTQFAGLGVHLLVVQLLKQIEPFFKDFQVLDEGGYWHTGDLLQLRRRLSACFVAMEDAKQENPGVDGPFRLGNGRIADLLQDQ